MIYKWAIYHLFLSPWYLYCLLLSSHTPVPRGENITKCELTVEQSEANIRGPVNAPRSILSPQTTWRIADKRTQTLLNRDAQHSRHFRGNFISDKT